MEKGTGGQTTEKRDRGTKRQWKREQGTKGQRDKGVRAVDDGKKGLGDKVTKGPWGKGRLGQRDTQTKIQRLRDKGTKEAKGQKHKARRERKN